MPSAHAWALRIIEFYSSKARINLQRLPDYAGTQSPRFPLQPRLPVLTDQPRGTGGNDVTGQQRHDVGYPTNQKVRRVDQIVGTSLYSHFSVDAAFGVEV